MVGQHDRRLAARHRFLGEPDALGNRMDLGGVEQSFAAAPRPGRHVVGDLSGQRRIAVGHDLEAKADIWHVGEGKAEEDVHIDVGFARFPDEGALHQVHPRRCAGPLQHGRRDDRHLHRHRGRHVVAANGAHQHARRALALEVAVVVREVFDREGHVGLGQEFRILVAVRIEGADDEGLAPDHLADAAGDVGLRSRDAAHAHRPVQAEIDPVERPLLLQAGDHPAHKCLVGLFRDPARAGAGARPQR